MSHIVFCPTCTRILYPVEDKLNHKLVLRCKYCNHCSDSPKDLTCTFRHDLVKEAKSELDQIKDDVVLDPTLQRQETTKCERCGGTEAVFFQASAGPKNAKKMSIFFVCTHCKNKWQG